MRQSRKKTCSSDIAASAYRTGINRAYDEAQQNRKKKQNDSCFSEK